MQSAKQKLSLYFSSANLLDVFREQALHLGGCSNQMIDVCYWEIDPQILAVLANFRPSTLSSAMSDWPNWSTNSGSSGKFQVTYPKFSHARLAKRLFVKCKVYKKENQASFMEEVSMLQQLFTSEMPLSIPCSTPLNSFFESVSRQRCS